MENKLVQCDICKTDMKVTQSWKRYENTRDDLVRVKIYECPKCHTWIQKIFDVLTKQATEQTTTLRGGKAGARMRELSEIINELEEIECTWCNAVDRESEI